MNLEQIYQKRCKELQYQLDIVEAHTWRLEDAIYEWCRMSGWCRVVQDRAREMADHFRDVTKKGKRRKSAKGEGK